jgi:ATPase subunit of ABC transporter with duplicated ATPase domains
LKKTVLEVVQEGVAEITAILQEYEEINEKFGLPEVYENADEMDKLLARQGNFRISLMPLTLGKSIRNWKEQWMLYVAPNQMRRLSICQVVSADV